MSLEKEPNPVVEAPEPTALAPPGKLAQLAHGFRFNREVAPPIVSVLVESQPEVASEKLEFDNPVTDVPVDAENTIPPLEYVTGVKLMLATGIVSLATFIMLLDTAIVATAVPKITSEFHSLSDIGWYGSAYLLTNASLQPLTGRLYSQLNPKFTYLAFMFVFECGSLLCGAAQSSKMLIVGRAVAGLGGAGMLNGALTIISACVPLEKRAAYLGIMMSVAQLGILLGPLLGGAFTEYASWRWCFYINLPIGALIGLGLFFIHVPDRRVKADIGKTPKAILLSLDLGGFVLFAPTIIMFLLALEWGGDQYPWDSATIIGLFCGSAALLALFLAWEYKKGDGAMIPLAMVRKKVVWCSMLVMFFFFGAMLTHGYYIAIYFQAVKGVSPTLSGVYILPAILSQVLFAVISGIGVTKLGYYLPWSIFGATMNSIGTGLLSSMTPGTSVANWVGYQMIGGIGRGSSLQMPMVAVQNHLPEPQHPVAMSVLMFAQTIGGAIIIAVSEAIFSSTLNDSIIKYAPGTNPADVVAAGAGNFRHVFEPKVVEGIILAYNRAVNHVFYVATGFVVAVWVVSWGLGWKSVKKAKVVVAEA